MISSEQIISGKDYLDEVIKDFWETSNELTVMMNNEKNLDKLFKVIMNTEWIYGRQIYKMLIPGDEMLEEVRLSMKMMWGGISEFEVWVPKFFSVSRLMHTLPSILSSRSYTGGTFDLLKFIEISWKERKPHKNFLLDYDADKVLHVITVMHHTDILDFLKKLDQKEFMSDSMRHLGNYPKNIIDGELKYRYCHLTPENTWKFFKHVGIDHKDPSEFFKISPSEI